MSAALRVLDQPRSSLHTAAILLAVLLAATQRQVAGNEQADSSNVQSTAGPGPSSTSKEAATKQSSVEPATKCKVVLRFYGRWDNEDKWVLLQSLPLQGVAGTVVNGLRRSQNFLGPLASKLLTALVARSARGLVQRRGWKPIVEKTMAEVGREFYLGYLVEPSSAKASRKISLVNPGGPHVEEAEAWGEGWWSKLKSLIERYIEATIPEVYTDPTIRFNRQVKDWGVEYTIDVGDPEEWRDQLPKLPELANFQLPDHMLNNSRRQLEEGDRFRLPDEAKDAKYAAFMDKVRAFQKDEEEKEARGEAIRPKKEGVSRESWFDDEYQHSDADTATSQPPAALLGGDGASMTVDTASIISLHPAKDVAQSTPSSLSGGGFFDFDELDKAYDELDKAYAAVSGESAVETSGGEDEDGLDSLSEVWPGDLPGFVEVDDDLPDLVPGPMEQGPMVWEVCVLRLLVRKAPDLSAPVQGICHERELLFEEATVERPDDSPEDWLCLDGQSGYVLKDGSRKDSRLGMLVKPFKLQGVPPDFCPSVLLTLKEGWRKARSSRPGVPLLRPNAVGKLRQLAEDAVSAASIGVGFDLEIFESEYQKGVETVRSEQGFFAQARSLLQKAERAAKPQSTRQYLPRFGVHQDSVHRWIEGMRQRILPNQADASEVVGKAAELLRREENMVKLQVPVGSTVHVVGDLHGQFWDLLHLLEMCGDPSPRNQYLFNGDFVDRGQFSVEVAFLLLALKVCYPRAVHLNRGNHEARKGILVDADGVCP
eukprot:s2006_g14.t1